MEEDLYFVPTKSCPHPKNHQVVILETQKPSNLKMDLGTRNEKIQDVESDLDMKKARFEIYKFAQYGLKNKDKQKSQVELALKLGAIPRKNKAINYKQLKEERNKVREEAKEREDLRELGRKLRPTRVNNKKTDTKNILRKKRKIGSNILNVYGKIRKKK